MATLSDLLRAGYTPPTESALADPIKEHFRTLPQQLEANQRAMDKTMAGMYKTDVMGRPNPNYYPEAMQEFTQNYAPNVMGSIAKVLPRKEVIANQINNLTNDIYGGLQEANKSTYPKIPVGNIFKNPQGKLPEGKIKSFDDIMEMEASLPTKEIDINAIVPTQRNINFDNLKKVKDVKNAKDAILAVENEGKYYLIDGHHRVANDILKNKDKINVRVYENK